MGHKEIQHQLKKEYEEKGYQVQLEVSLPYQDSFLIVDLIATNNKEKIAIEIGHCTKSKLDFLKKKGYDVILHPYIQKSEEGYLKHICGYIWKPRVDNPKECPSCKARLTFEEDNDEKEN